MWVDTKIAKGVIILPFRKVKELCPQFAVNITEDIHHLATLERGLLPQHSALRKVRKSRVFVFKHSTHMACSSVSYTAVLKGMRQFENNPGHICCDVKNDMVHHLLQPFFGCNEEVQTVCKSLLRDESTTTEGKSSIDKLDAKIYR